jgi:putative transposase
VTYIWTLQGWLYLAVIIDLFSRWMVGWSRSSNVMLRRPFEYAQYASADYQQLLTACGLRGSMSRRGDCWDNAMAESFFATLKLELVYQVQWPIRAAARTIIFEDLELFYNRRRRHSSLGYRSVAEFERCNYQRLAA